MYMRSNCDNCDTCVLKYRIFLHLFVSVRYLPESFFPCFLTDLAKFQVNQQEFNCLQADSLLLYEVRKNFPPCGLNSTVCLSSTYSKAEWWSSDYYVNLCIFC